MNAVWVVALADLRRRRRELLLFGLLVAMASGAVMATTVAALRSETSIERFLEWSRLSTAGLPVDPDDPGPMVEALQSIPEIRAVAASSTISLFVDTDDPAVPFRDLTLTVADPLADEWTDGVAGIDIDRPILLDGRMPRPDRREEVLLLEWMADASGWEIGDRLTARTLARSDIEQVELERFPGLNGPVVELEVVGIGRSGNDLSGQSGDTRFAGWGSSQLLVETRDDALWWPPGVDFWTTDGDLDEFELVERLGAAVVPESLGFFAGSFVGGVTDARTAAIETATTTVSTMSIGLAIFAGAALLASAIVIGQAVGRHVAGSADTIATLDALGQRRRDRALAVTVPVMLATLGGVVAGAGAAIIASRWLPTGLARRAEVDPGIWVRPELIIPIGLVSAGLVTGGCFVLAVRRAPRRQRSARSPGAGALSRLSASPAVAAGLRMALLKDRPPRDVPIRSAVTGFTIAVFGAAAALLVVVNVGEITGTPARWGWTWSSSPEYLGDDPDGVIAELLDDTRIDAAGFFLQNGVSVNGSPLGGFAVDPLMGLIEIPTREGRSPEGPGEIALGDRTRRRLGVAIGETVALGTFSGDDARTVTVVGTAVFAYDIAETSDDGAFMLPELLNAVADPSYATEDLLLRYSPGTSAEDVERELAEELDLVFTPYSGARPPPEVKNLDVTAHVSIALAAFFLGIGLLAVSHAGLVAGRRRRLDIAVLRALGMLRRQIRLAFFTQSLVFGAIALAIGIPTGLLVGRILWRSVTDDLGIVTTLTVPWWAIAAIVPVGFVLAAGLSWWPGRAAAQRDPTDALRAE